MKFISIIAFTLYLMVHPFSIQATFTISAEVERSLIMPVDSKTVRSYLENLEIYPKNFPNMISVKKINDKESEWSYKVEYPLAEPWTVEFDELEKDDNDTSILFESIDPTNNYLYCHASISTPGQNQTSILFKIKVTLTRDKASDIHFLAGVLGERFISEKMKDKLDDGLNTFIKNISGDLLHNNKF